MTQEFTIHVGANKTGSSAIQRFVQINRELLGDRGYAVPDRNLEWTNQVSGEHVFAFEKLMSGPRVSDNILTVFDRLASDAPTAKTILLSAENLSNLGKAEAFGKAAEKYRLKIILYIRRQDEMLTSSWQQWHSKSESDFDAWLLRGIRTIGHWERVINGWESVAGTEALSIRVFERDSFLNGDIQSDFLSTLGLDPKAVKAQYTSGEINPSYSDVITDLVAGNRSIFFDPHDLTFQKMIEKFEPVQSKRTPKISLLSPRQRDYIIEYFEAQNQRVCKRFFPNRPRLFELVDHRKYNYVTDDVLRKMQLRFLMQSLVQMYKQFGNPK